MQDTFLKKKPMTHTKKKEKYESFIKYCPSDDNNSASIQIINVTDMNSIKLAVLYCTKSN